MTINTPPPPTPPPYRKGQKVEIRPEHRSGVIDADDHRGPGRLVRVWLDGARDPVTLSCDLIRPIAPDPEADPTRADDLVQ